MCVKKFTANGAYVFQAQPMSQPIGLGYESLLCCGCVISVELLKASAPCSLLTKNKEGYFLQRKAAQSRL